MPTSVAYPRPALGAGVSRREAAERRLQGARERLAKGASTLKPSSRALRSIALAALVATGAFGAVMLRDPPRTIVADPNVTGSVFSPLALAVPANLPSGDYAPY